MATFCFGKSIPKIDEKTLMLSNYLTPILPSPPLSFDNLQTVYSKLNISNPKKLFPVDGNNTVGDCTIAALGHIITVYSGLIGIKKIPTKASILKLYYQLTKGEDTGLACLDVLNYWRKNSFSGDEIIVYAKIKHPKNHTEVQQAIHLFGGVYLGFNVQENAITDFKKRIPWTSGKLTGDGHCVDATSYDQTGVTLLTWGNTQIGTWEWWDECVDECYAIIPPEAKNPSFTPGLNYTQLLADLSLITK
jgi:hypothetical protein